MIDNVQDYWIRRYREIDALWIHDGVAHKPHAVLASGVHSNGFFNSEIVMQDPRLLDEACMNLIELMLDDENIFFNQIDRVVGPAMGAITLAHDMARHISFKKALPCLRGYVEKMDDRPDSPMHFRRVGLEVGERVLLVEDVITSGNSVKKASQAVLEAGGIISPPVIVALVNRSGLLEVDGKKIIALINRPILSWSAEECPLCAHGSEALVKPKLAENWERLKL